MLKSFKDKLFRFFTRDIWKFRASHTKGFGNLCKSYLKTLLQAVRIFYIKDMWARDVSALTFATLMAFIPFMAMMFVIARGFGYTELLEQWLKTTFSAQPGVADAIVTFVNNYIDNSESNYIIGFGIIVLLYTVVMLMQKIERSFDDIWHTKRRSWMKIITEYPTIFFCFGLMIIFASGINIGVVSATEHIDDFAYVGKAVPSFGLRLVAFVPMFLFFLFFYNVIPNTYIRFRCTLLPALISGVCMSAFQYLYISLQVYLSSYNVIYGSFAALPLLFIWMQMSWAITMFGAILCYANQNLHHFDGDIEYAELKYVQRLKVCAIIMHYICERFRKGEKAYSAKDIHDITGIPQQIINGGMLELLEAQLIVEIKSEDKGVREELSIFQPIEWLNNLTYGTMVERIASTGKGLSDVEQYAKIDWSKIDAIQSRYIRDGRNIQLAKL